MNRMQILKETVKAQTNAMIQEDEGLFPNGVVTVRVALMPRVGENSRQDWVVAGHLTYGAQVEVVFAGRRAPASDVLRKTLADHWRKAMAVAKREKKPMPAPESVNLPVTIEGGWRAVFTRDADGCETRKYQLVAARWTYVGAGGIVDVMGEPVLSENAVDMSVIPPVPARRRVTAHVI